MGNIYFELTEELNARETIALLTSGQAVVFYRIAMMSKDGDWVLRETPGACDRVLEVLGARGARYRPGAPLDVRWLSGGWSSHFQFHDEKGRRIRCDFLSRPPRVPPAILERNFAATAAGKLRVLELPALILMKQTQRAKDYPVIGELARKLAPDQELEFTTDPDRILELAPQHGSKSARPPVQAALAGKSRGEVVVALAREIDALQEKDRRRLLAYEEASARYREEFRRSGVAERPLREAHAVAVELAARLLPQDPRQRQR
jgi:hypothetical protein